MPDTPDTRGRKPNPQRKNCGFKNIRIRVDGAYRYYEKPAGDNVPSGQTRGGGGYFRNFWVGLCRWDPGTFSLYQS